MLNSVVLVPLLLRRYEIFPRGYFAGPKFFLVGISRVPNFFSWVCCGSKICCRGGISWVRNFFSSVFCGSKIFSRGYFEGPKFFLFGISWVQDFFYWVFCESKIFFLVGVSRFWNFFRWHHYFNMNSSHDIFFLLILSKKL